MIKQRVDFVWGTFFTSVCLLIHAVQVSTWQETNGDVFEFSNGFRLTQISNTLGSYQKRHEHKAKLTRCVQLCSVISNCTGGGFNQQSGLCELFDIARDGENQIGTMSDGVECIPVELYEDWTYFWKVYIVVFQHITDCSLC